VSGLSSSTSYDFYVTAVDGAGNESSDSNIITVTTNSGGGLPSPWSNQDVGTVSASGSASESSGTFTINGAGSDIWGSSDEFHYVYQSLSGDGSMVAQVQSVENTNSWAKAGVMIRETLDADSRHAMMIVTPGQGTSFQYRSSTGGTSNDSTPGDGITAPHWVKIERSGDTLTGYKSSDGSSWTQVGSTTITMATDVKIGMPVTSHNDGTLCTADFSDTSVSSGGSGGTTEDAGIVQASSAPTIDGSVDSVWSNANQYALNNSVGTISSSGDCSADWKALWDSNNLYLLAEVTDNSLTTDSSSAFKDDMVEVYIDGDNSGGSSYDGTNDFQYGFRYDDASVYTGSNSVSDTTGVNHASTSTSGGWRLEVEIPWSTIGVSVSDGSVVGLDVHVVDDDDGGDRDGKLMWHDTDDDAYTDPSTFGDAELL
jgi:regulation of enolase protein 1 (concanavalin A-like superfamily)